MGARSSALILMWAMCIFCTACLLSCAQSKVKPEPLVPDSKAKGATAAAWSPGGTRLAIANPKRIWIFDTETRQQIRELRSVREAPGRKLFNYRYGLGNSLQFINERQVATTGMGAMLSIWDVDNGKLLESFNWPEDDGYPVSLAYDRSSNTLAAATGTGMVFLANPGSGEKLRTLSGYEGAVFALQFGRDSNYLGAAGTGPDMVIWDIGSEQEFARLPVTAPVLDIEPIGEQGEFLVAGEELQVWNFLTEEQAQALGNPGMEGQKAAAAALGVLYLGSIIVAITTPFVGSMLADSVPHFAGAAANQGWVSCQRSVAVSPDGKLLADIYAGITHEKIRIIDIDSASMLRELDPRGGESCGMAFSPDGKQLLIANQRGGHLYDTSTWEVTRLKNSYIDIYH